MRHWQPRQFQPNDPQSSLERLEEPWGGGCSSQEQGPWGAGAVPEGSQPSLAVPGPIPLTAMSIGKAGAHPTHPRAGAGGGLGNQDPARAAAVGQPWGAVGSGKGGGEGLTVDICSLPFIPPASHHLSINSHFPFISIYFPFPFIMINTWRLCWIKYWLLRNIFINTHIWIYISACT